MRELLLLKGTELPVEEQAYVLSAYIHRFTGNHTPNWAHAGMPNGNPYPVQFASDQEWLENTEFRVTRTGKVYRAQGAECISRPTWPKNPELRR